MPSVIFYASLKNFETLEMSRSFEIGTRIEDLDGFKATVRYIGPVSISKNKEEIWLGNVNIYISF